MARILIADDREAMRIALKTLFVLLEEDDIVRVSKYEDVSGEYPV
jgi:hypothetical protein